MKDADLWVFEIDSNMIIGNDCYSSDRKKPPTDASLGGRNDIEILGFYYN